MCLAIPGKIKSIDFLYGGTVKMAKVSFGGIIKEGLVEMIPAGEVGDYVLVNVGFGISIVNEEEAHKVFGYLKEAGELDELYDTTT